MLILALDFGGTKHTAGLARAQPGKRPVLVATRRQASPAGSDGPTDLKTMFSLAHSLLSEQAETPAAVGVSFGGPVDFPARAVRLSHHVPGWQGVPLAQMVEAEFGAPAAVDNDANCGALGEWRYGAGQGCSSLLYMTVSTGIGGGWLIDGKVHRGADSMAGEIGHTPVDPDGPECVCGRRGCLEIMACGPAIARCARERLRAHPNEGTLLRRLAGGDLTAITGEMVSRAAAQGDSAAGVVLLAAAHDLGTGIGNALSLMNPQRVVLGGGVTKSGKRYWAELRRSARANTLPEISAEIVPARLSDAAPLWGAIAMAEEICPPHAH
jgi:glucokinase